MLEPMDLDGSEYGELYADTLARACALAPHWEARPSDPGVALLELFSFLADVQNHAVNTVTDEHLNCCLELLGMERAATASARVLVSPRFEGESLRLPEGARFAAGKLFFETERAACFHRNRLQLFLVGADGRETAFSPGTPSRLFACEAEQLVLKLDEPAGDGEQEFWFRIAPCTGRCPPQAGMEPLAAVAVEVWAESKWLPAELEDETYGFLQSGIIRILAPQCWKKARFRVTRGRFDFPPVLLEAVLHPLSLRQTRTLACIGGTDHFLASQGRVTAFLREGDGWREVPVEAAERELERMRLVCTEPDFPARRPLTGMVSESIRLEETGILPESLRLMQKEGILWYDCPVTEPGIHTLPRGCRYDREKGTLCFGDGRDFAIPPPGELLICGLQTTNGADGNAAAETIRSQEMELYQPEAATGGREEESPQEALHRAPVWLCEKKRAVTLADYEELALRVPGLVIEKARALPLDKMVRGARGVALLLKPGAAWPRPELGALEKERVLRFLEPYRMLTVCLRVFGARYLAVRVRLRVTLYREEADWEKKLRAVLLEYTDGTEGRLSFGETVSRPALFRQLEKQPFILRVEELTLLPGGPQGRLLPDGSIQPGPDVLPYLEKFSLHGG